MGPEKLSRLPWASLTVLQGMGWEGPGTREGWGFSLRLNYSFSPLNCDSEWSYILDCFLRIFVKISFHFINHPTIRSFTIDLFITVQFSG